MLTRHEATQQLVNLLNLHPNNTRFSDLELQTIANLLQQNADATVKNHWGTTLLHLLIYYNFDGKYNGFIEFLVLEKNLNVDVVNAEGYTPLQKLIDSEFSIDCAVQLALYGANIEKLSPSGRNLIAMLHQDNINGKNDSVISLLHDFSHVKDISNNFYYKLNIDQNNIAFINSHRTDNLAFRPFLLKQIFAKIEASQRLIELSISNINLNGFQIRWLIHMLSHSSLQALTLNNVTMSWVYEDLLAQSLTNNTCLQSLSFCNSKLNSRSMVVFAAALKNNKHLRNLDLSKNLFNNQCVIAISHLCANNKYLQNINLDSNKFSETDLKIFLTMYKANPYLKLSCDKNVFLDKDVVYLTCRNSRIEVVKKISITTNIEKKEFKEEVAYMQEVRNHPYIVNIRQSYMDADFGYIIMKHFPTTLLDCIDEDRIPHHWGLKITLMHQIAKGLDYIHRKKIIHRDIKPDNIYLTADGVPKIADFGVSTQKEKTYVGTLGYQAPEVAAQTGFNSFKSDIYCYGLVSLDIAFTSTEESSEKVDGEITLPLGCPNNLKIMINKCLKKDSNKRPTTRKLLDQFKVLSQENLRVLLNQCPIKFPLDGDIIKQIVHLCILQNIDAKNDQGESVLHLFVHHNENRRYDRFINKLVKHGANINILNNDKLTPYQILISKPTVDFHSALHFIKLGALSTLRNTNGQPLIHLLVENNQANLIIMLIKDYHSNIDTFNQAGETALQYLMNKKPFNKEMAMLLASLGADITVKSANGLTLSEILALPSNNIDGCNEEAIALVSQYSLQKPNSSHVASLGNITSIFQPIPLPLDTSTSPSQLITSFSR